MSRSRGHRPTVWARADLRVGFVAQQAQRKPAAERRPGCPRPGFSGHCLCSGSPWCATRLLAVAHAVRPGRQQPGEPVVDFGVLRVEPGRLPVRRNVSSAPSRDHRGLTSPFELMRDQLPGRGREVADTFWATFFAGQPSRPFATGSLACHGAAFALISAADSGSTALHASYNSTKRRITASDV